MTADYPVDEVPATPEYVLAVLRDWHQIAVAAGEADAISITYETSFHDWEDSFGVDWWGRGGLRKAINDSWCIDIPSPEWKEFARVDRTLDDFCRLISKYARQPVLRPWKSIAGECLPAGAFLTVRAMLAKTGVGPGQITPSVSLAPYLSRQHTAFWLEFARAFPMRGPVPSFPHWVASFRQGTRLLGLPFLLATVVLAMVGPTASWMIPLGSLFVVALILWLLEWRTVFWEFQDKSIVTFRDLAYCLAGQVPRRPIQPTA
jgi:hypothetical protein